MILSLWYGLFKVLHVLLEGFFCVCPTICKRAGLWPLAVNEYATGQVSHLKPSVPKTGSGYSKVERTSLSLTTAVEDFTHAWTSSEMMRVCVFLEILEAVHF